MSALSTTSTRRALHFTRTRLATASLRPISRQLLRPLPSSSAPSFASPLRYSKRQYSTVRSFHNTSTMGEKEGVHNLMSKADFDKVLAEKDDKLVVLDCYATWCGPCKVIAPQVVKFSDAYPNAKFFKLDVDEVSDVAQELGIRAMPTFLLFKNGDKIGEVVGANPKALEAAIQANYGEA